MDCELIERLAREAGFDGDRILFDENADYIGLKQLHRFAALVAEECAREADEEEHLRTSAGRAHPEESESRGRCFAAARAAANIGRCIRAKFKEQ